MPTTLTERVKAASCTPGVPCSAPPQCNVPGPPRIPSKAREEVLTTVSGLDLDRIKLKLMESDRGEGWTQAQADNAEVKYKRFLFLNAVYDEDIVPTEMVDKLWHQHILDTRKYTADCESVFGFYLHHFPYFGMRGKADAENARRAFTRSCEIYRAEFGEEYGAAERGEVSG